MLRIKRAFVVTFLAIGGINRFFNQCLRSDYKIS